MTKDEALRMAIEYLTNIQLDYKGHEVRKALQESLAQPAQEPVGYIGVITLQRIKSNYSGIDGYGISLKKLLENDIPLYTHPAPAWQGLSDDEKKKIWFNLEHEIGENIVFGGKLADAIEQALKEKNT